MGWSQGVLSLVVEMVIAADLPEPEENESSPVGSDSENANDEISNASLTLD